MNGTESSKSEYLLGNITIVEKFFNKLVKNRSLKKKKLEFYESLIDLIKRNGAERKHKLISGCEVQIDDFMIQAGNKPREDTRRVTVIPSLDSTIQKNLIQALLQKLKQLIDKDLNLESFAYLKLEYICEYLILKYVLKSYENSNKKSSNISELLITQLEHLLIKKQWKINGTLSKTLSTLSSKCHLLTITLEPLFKILEVLGKQTHCLDLSLAELGLTPLSEPESLTSTLQDFIHIEQSVLRLIKPLLNKCTFEENQSKIVNSLKYLYESGSSNVESLTAQLILVKKKLHNKIVLLQRSIKLDSLEQDCKKVAETTIPSQFVSNIHSYLSHSYSLRSRYLISNKSIQHLILKGQRNLEILLSINQPEKKASCSFRVKHLLECAVEKVFFDKLKLKIRQYCNQEDGDLPFTLGKTTFFNFLINLWKLIPSTETEADSQIAQMEEKMMHLLVSEKRGKETWYQEFIDQITTSFVANYGKYIKHLDTINSDWYQLQGLLYRDILLAERHRGVGIFLEELSKKEELTQHIPKITRDDFFNSLYKLMKGHLRINYLFNLSQNSCEIALENFNLIKKNHPEFPQTPERVKGHFQITKSLAELQSLQQHMKLGTHFLNPAIKLYQNKLKGIYQKDLDSWQSMDLEDLLKRRPKKIKRQKSVFTPPKTIFQKSIKKEKSNSRSKTPSPLSLQTVGDSFFYDNHSTSDRKFYAPHKISSYRKMDEWGIFAQDYAYHLNHAMWSLEMMVRAVLSGKHSLISALGSHLVSYLYLSQEQVTTPQYLSLPQSPQLHHGLVSMNQALDCPIKMDNDKGSFWDRYPYASAQRYHAQLPLGLDLILQLEENEDWENIHPIIEGLLTLAKDGFEYNATKIREGTTASEELETHLKKMHSKLHDVVQTLDLALEEKEKEKEVETASNVEHALNTAHQTLNRILDASKTVSEELLNNPTYQDLFTHIKRFDGYLRLLQEFPEQRFWSLHERNIKVGCQFICEIACALLSTQLGEDLQTHNLDHYASHLGLEIDLTGLSFKTFSSLNMKKGSEYIYWEFYKNQQIPPVSTLKDLSIAYEISLAATAFGDGFMPSSLHNVTLEEKQKNLIKFIENGVGLIEELVNLIS